LSIREQRILFFKADRIVAANKRWDADFMTRFRYRSLRQAHENMLCCEAERREGRIKIRPFLRDRSPGYWTDMPEERTVDIPATDDIAILGAATKLALSRCKPQRRDTQPL
jgi:CDI immunity protein